MISKKNENINKIETVNITIEEEVNKMPEISEEDKIKLRNYLTVSYGVTEKNIIIN